MSDRRHPIQRASCNTRRRAGRQQRRVQRSRALNQLAWRSLENPYAPTNVLSEDQVEAIHLASLTLLEEQGIEFLLPQARELLMSAGVAATARQTNVKLDRDFVLEAVAHAPSEFKLHARNPERSLMMGGRHVNFCSVASAPNASDIKGGRRTGNRQDFQDFIRLGQSLNSLMPKY